MHEGKQTTTLSDDVPDLVVEVFRMLSDTTRPTTPSMPPAVSPPTTKTTQ